MDLIRNVVERHYDIGEVLEVKQLFGGAINQSFEVLVKDGVETEIYFARLYVPDKEENEIIYEHGLLEHIKTKGFELNSLPVRSREGTTFIKEKHDGQERFYSIHEWLKGDEPYGWVDSNCTDKACKNATEALADFHCKAYDYEPQEGCMCKEPVMSQQLKYYEKDFRLWVSEIAKDPSKQHYSKYMKDNLEYIVQCINKCLIMYEEAENLIVTNIHTDAHLGNYKFVDDEVTGLFDFDWAKKDVRLYDVAMSAGVFCSSWFYDNIGELSTDLLKIFLESYNGFMSKSDCPLGPLNEDEKKHLPMMMIATNLYIMHACTGQLYENRDLNGFEWLYYMIHQVESFKWIEENMSEIEEIAKNN